MGLFLSRISVTTSGAAELQAQVAIRNFAKIRQVWFPAGHSGVYLPTMWLTDQCKESFREKMNWTNPVAVGLFTSCFSCLFSGLVLFFVFNKRICLFQGLATAALFSNKSDSWKFCWLIASLVGGFFIYIFLLCKRRWSLNIHNDVNWENS